MPNILIIKMSSLGDVVHNLPVVADIHEHVGNAHVDWVVEENFAKIPSWHKGVHRVLPIALRRWRKTPGLLLRELKAFKASLASTNYDFIVDSQGLIKSAMVAKLARGKCYGFTANTAREPLSALFYKQTYEIARQQHAVVRNRELFAAVFGYNLTAPANFGVQAPTPDAPWLPQRPYAILLHACSAAKKMWGEDNWIALGKALYEHGVISILPGGNPQELALSQYLAEQIPQALAPPWQDLRVWARVLAQAKLVVGVDTGLTHLAAALRTPVVAIYGATDPALTGVYDQGNQINIGSQSAFPSMAEVLAAVTPKLA